MSFSLSKSNPVVNNSQPIVLVYLMFIEVYIDHVNVREEKEQGREKNKSLKRAMKRKREVSDKKKI